MLLGLLIGTWYMGMGVALIEFGCLLIKARSKEGLIGIRQGRALIDSWRGYARHTINISFARLSVTYVTGRGPGQRSNYRIK